MERGPLPSGSLLSFRVAVVRDAAIVHREGGKTAATLDDAIATLRARSGELDVVVIDEATLADVLILVYESVPSASLEEMAERRRGGEDGTRAVHVLAPRDTGAIGWLDAAGVAPLRLEFPPRYVGDTSREADFWDAVAHRSRLAADLRERHVAPATVDDLRLALDDLANDLQRNADFARLGLYAVGFTTLTVHAIGGGQVITIVQYALFALAIAAYAVIRSRAFASRHQDYRTIAEALRVHAVWREIGLDARLDASYLAMQQTELAWIRDVLRVATAIDRERPAVTPDPNVVETWIAGQVDYFRRAATRNARERARFGLAMEVLGYGALATGIAAFALSIFTGGRSLLDGLLGGVTIWAIGAAFLCRELVRDRMIAENVNRYQRMFFVFERALDVVRDARDRRLVGAVAHQLGVVALSEHADWLFTQRERPIVLPPAVPR